MPTATGRVALKVTPAAISVSVCRLPPDPVHSATSAQASSAYAQARLAVGDQVVGDRSASPSLSHSSDSR
jgi:hypothetical protein